MRASADGLGHVDEWEAVVSINRSMLAVLIRAAGIPDAYQVAEVNITPMSATFTVLSLDLSHAKPMVDGDRVRTFTWTSALVGEWPSSVEGGDLADVAGALVAYRRASGLSRSQVGARMGSTPSNVRWIERNMLDAEIEAVYRYARAIGLRLSLTVQSTEPTP